MAMVAHDLCDILHGLKPAMVMVLVQSVLAGANIFYKLATNDGMNMEILVAYRYLVAAAIMVPLAFFFERKSRPKLTWTVAFQAFLCGLFGSTMVHNLMVASLVLTSATFTAAMLNLVPAFTLIMALAFRLERLAVQTAAGKAKVVGTLISLGGAMVLTLYKGVEINLWSTNVDLLHHDHGGHVTIPHAEFSYSVLGSLLAVGCCLSYAIWLILQTKMSERYPCHLSSAALMCLMGSIQSVVYALCREREWAQWKLGWNIRLLTVAYTGVLASGLVVTLMTWAIRLRGPLFVSAFNPLMIVVVAVIGSFLLDEKLHVGSIIGAVLIVCGLYVVLWGKGKETRRKAQPMLSKNSRESEHTKVVISSSGTITNCNNDVSKPVNTGNGGMNEDFANSSSNVEERKSNADERYKEEKKEVEISSLTTLDH